MELKKRKMKEEKIKIKIERDGWEEENKQE